MKTNKMLADRAPTPMPEKAAGANVGVCRVIAYHNSGVAVKSDGAVAICLAANDNGDPPDEPQTCSSSLTALYDVSHPFWKQLLANKVPANDVNDVAQQAATILYLRRASIVAGKEKAFARGIVQNLLGSFYRQQRKREFVTADLEDVPNGYDVDALVDARRSLRQVVQVVEQMSESDRAALKYLGDGRDVDDIGFHPTVSKPATTERMALSDATGRQRRHRAKDRLKTIIQHGRRLKLVASTSGPRSGKNARRPY